MTNEIVEEYVRFFRPDHFKEHDQRIALAVAAMLPADWADWRRRYWIEELSKHDPAMMEAAGMTVEEFVDLRDAHRQRRRGGQVLPQGPDRVRQRQMAYRAIYDADLAEISWGEAIERAQVVSRIMIGSREREIDRKTLDSWLRALHEWGVIQIDPPKARGRGRPRKKE
jgi:hypothetical protein